MMSTRLCVAPLDAFAGFVPWHMPEPLVVFRLWHVSPASPRSTSLRVRVVRFVALAPPGRRPLAGPRSTLA
jgi:hypothetical protein